MPSAGNRGVHRRVNQTTLYVEDVGAGEAILFSHGLLFSASMFSAQIEALSSKYRCVAYDHRGQGRSADSSGDEIDVDTLTADAADLIRSLGLRTVHFVGHSLGGFVGLRLAVRYPELLQSLILCNTSADSEPAKNLPKYRMMSSIARWLGPPAVVNALVPIVFGTSVVADRNRRSEVNEWRAQLASNRRSIYRAANGVINRAAIYDELPKVTVPTLVLTGDEDKARTVAESKRIVDAIAGAKLICVPQAGHMLPLERPAAMTDAIFNFVTRCNTGAPECSRK